MTSEVPLEASAESLSEAFGTVARRMRSASIEALSRYDVTPGQMRAIRSLVRHGEEGGLRASELAQHLHIAPRSATEVVDALEAKGIVARSPDPADRRATLVALTEQGMALTEALRQARGAESGRLFERLSPDERAELARLLHKVLDAPPTEDH